jgi:hypothetical protein
MAALGFVNLSVGVSVIGGAARFYFHKNKPVAVACDEVYFGFSSAGPVIAGEHGHSNVAQVAMREIFTTSAECCFRCKRPPLPELSCSIA